MDTPLNTWIESVLPDRRWSELGDATTAQLFRSDDGFVVKAYANADFVAEYPDCVTHAVSAMAHVSQHTDLTIPEVVAFDAVRRAVGCPGRRS